ncbi:MAG: Two component signal transduction histidine kinase [Chloroflexi bacterium]|nr:Two component signal transduction histidine kinase [Chloroflexota bacterium]
MITGGSVVLSVQLLRAQLMRAADRLVFGRRGNAHGILTRIDQLLTLGLPTDAILPTIAEAIGTALKLPYTAVTLFDAGPRTLHETVEGAPPLGPVPDFTDWDFSATYGMPSPAALRVPLVYAAEIVGYMYLSPRPGRMRFSAADRRVLADLAAHIGIIIHVMCLAIDLQRSRERLATAREKERRCLGRNLHDGLGPQLASFTLTLTAAREHLARDPATTDALLRVLTEHVQGAVSEMHRLVYDLRPHVLDELGLVGALVEQAARCSQGGLQVRVEATPPRIALPANVEKTAYCICLEALTNVVRHAHAKSCLIRIDCDYQLAVEIIDDGISIAMHPTAEQGLRSMRERIEELGGYCTIEPIPSGGTRVAALLPRLEQ